jgi:hypothetical protein
VKNTLLHDIYKKVDKEINFILSNYRANNYKILKDIINNNNILRTGESKTILILFLLGNKTVINICFKLVVEILTGKTEGKTEENAASNRTNILFKIADRLYKLVMSGLTNLNTDSKIKLIDTTDKDINKLLKLWNGEFIKSYLVNMNEAELLNLGDTVLRFILNKSDVLSEYYITENNNTTIKLIINNQFLHDLTISSINITQLPMLIKPRLPKANGEYFPYMLP